MIEINLLKEEAASELCRKYGVTGQSGLLVYCAVEGDTQLGSCIFSIDGETGRLFRVDMVDGSLYGIADGLVRSALSLMVQRGARLVTCDGGVDGRLLLGTGFTQNDGIWQREISESFFAGCSG